VWASGSRIAAERLRRDAGPQATTPLNATRANGGTRGQERGHHLPDCGPAATLPTSRRQCHRPLPLVDAASGYVHSQAQSAAIAWTAAWCRVPGLRGWRGCYHIRIANRRQKAKLTLPIVPIVVVSQRMLE